MQIGLVFSEQELGNWPSGPVPATSWNEPRVSWAMVRVAAPSSAIRGLGRQYSLVSCHVQLLRNQSVGNRWSGAASGPRLATVRRIKISSGEAFAYSAVTSKYRLSLKRRCRSARIQAARDYAGDSPPQAVRREIPPAGICRALSSRNGVGVESR